MAERRMFAKTIIDSDAFLDMPQTTQNLYFHLSMRADDEGFINNPKRIARTIGAGDDDLRVLIAKKFVIGFESGVIVIKHWKIHNYIRGDRIQKTNYTEERSMIDTKDNGAYTLCQSLGGHLADNPPSDDSIGKDRLGKDRLGKDSIGDNARKRTTFTKPTLQEVQSRIVEMNYSIDAERFISYYESNGWMVGRTKMKDWKAALTNWSKSTPKQTYKPTHSKVNTTMQAYDELCREREAQGRYIEGEIV